MRRHKTLVRCFTIGFSCALSIGQIAFPQSTGTFEIAPLPGDPGGSVATRVIRFTVAEAELDAGASSHVDIDVTGAAELTGVELDVSFEPPIFTATPSIQLKPGVTSTTIGVQSPWPGTYRVSFGNDPLSVVTGGFLTLSGIASTGIVDGDEIEISITSRATPVDGDPVVLPDTITTRMVGAGTNGLVLRVNDQTDVLPGSRVLVEIRTYNPKPISEGQVCFSFEPTFFSSVTQINVVSSSTDVSYVADTSMPGIVLVTFDSPSAAINRIDGPLLEVEMELHLDLAPGRESLVQVDLPQSYLLDDRGRTVPLSMRAGRFRVTD